MRDFHAEARAAQKELSGPHRGQALEGPRRPSQALAGPSRGPSSAFYAGRRRPSQALAPRTARPCARFCGPGSAAGFLLSACFLAVPGKSSHHAALGGRGTGTGESCSLL